MAHFTCEEFVSFFSLLSPGHVKEYSAHDSIADARIVPLTTRRNPANLLAQHDAEIDLVWSCDGPRCRECGSNSVTVGRMNVPGQFLESDLGSPGQAP